MNFEFVCLIIIFVFLVLLLTFGYQTRFSNLFNPENININADTLHNIHL
jgi:hypothetical protein